MVETASTNFAAAAQYVDRGLKLKSSGEMESASGPGSTMLATSEVRTLIESLIASDAVRSILDLGCGDWNWMQHVRLVTGSNTPVTYCGWDSNAELVEHLNTRHGNAHCRFELKDIVKSPLPQADLIICRDVLFHMPVEMAVAVAGKIRESGTLFLTTTFPGEPGAQDLVKYVDITGWGFRRVNLDIPPFGLLDQRAGLVHEPHCTHQGVQRFAAVYQFAPTAGAVPDATIGTGAAAFTINRTPNAALRPRLRNASRIIWQYWETKGEKPAFVDELHALAKRNSGVRVVLVTPQNINRYLPDRPPWLDRMDELAHKADIIRVMLVKRHGGMWLDSDAMVLRDLNFIFDHLAGHDFVGFNLSGGIDEAPLHTSVNCFAARPNSKVVTAWGKKQRKFMQRLAKSPAAIKVPGWNAVGSRILDRVCAEYLNEVKLLPFRSICPVLWNESGAFTSETAPPVEVIAATPVVMLSNHQLAETASPLPNMTLAQIAGGNFYLSHFAKAALAYQPGLMTRLKRLLAMS